MKMYIWSNPLPGACGITGSALIVVANSLEEAKELGMKAKVHEWADNDAYPLEDFDNKFGQRVDLQQPDRVLDLPCAEYHIFLEQDM